MYTNLNIKIDLVKAFLLLKNTYYMQTEIFSFCVQKNFRRKIDLPRGGDLEV